MYLAWEMVTSWECRSGLRDAMTTGFPAITPNNDHTLTAPSTWTEVPQGTQASLGTAAQSFLLGTNFQRDRETDRNQGDKKALASRARSEPRDLRTLLSCSSSPVAIGTHTVGGTRPHPLLLTHLTERGCTGEKDQIRALVEPGLTVKRFLHEAPTVKASCPENGCCLPPHRCRLETMCSKISNQHPSRMTVLRKAAALLG